MDEEKSLIDYFQRIRIYAKFQDPEIPPNLLDTRKTFLKKMENQDMREKFLETYNRVNFIFIAVGESSLFISMNQEMRDALRGRF